MLGCQGKRLEKMLLISRNKNNLEFYFYLNHWILILVIKIYIFLKIEIKQVRFSQTKMYSNSESF